tara:strand:+ start:3055 stop:3480 length:426 start_codon:yes stop_codon:yes gene_type:complete
MKHLKEIPLIDWVTMLGISATLLLMLTYATGCAVRAKVYTNQEACCERLDVRMKEMEEFNRYCMMMVFADRKEEDPKVKEDIQRRLNLCKYVFGVPRDQDLLSHLESRTPVSGNDVWRRVYYDFWNPPVSCDPSHIHCEEF